jgi:hypothetical protein
MIHFFLPAHNNIKWLKLSTKSLFLSLTTIWLIGQCDATGHNIWTQTASTTDSCIMTSRTMHILQQIWWPHEGQKISRACNLHGSYGNYIQSLKIMVFSWGSIHFCMKDVICDQRKLHSEDLHDRYCLANKISVIKPRTITWVRHVVHIKEKWQRPTAKPRCWQHNIKTYLNKILDRREWTGVIWPMQRLCCRLLWCQQ